ncbi:MAG: phosphoribosylformylglycinamidine synthase subunit PurQ [Sphaerochaetaceae bacterium]|jgi:phosphoribosylformylglycinamidine synthase
MKARLAVIEFPGTNDITTVVKAAKKANIEAVVYRWNEKELDFSSFDAYVLAGGFSFQDRSRGGIIAALDPLMEKLKSEDAKGKPILGINNGAQILLEAGLVPGFDRYEVAGSCAPNLQLVDNTVLDASFYHATVFVKPLNSSLFFENTVIEGYIGTTEGRFVFEPEVLKMLYENKVAMLQYCDFEGTVAQEFPTNPTGSMDNLAAIGNHKGNVLASMVQPKPPALSQMLLAMVTNKKLKSSFVPFTLPSRAPSKSIRQATQKDAELIVGTAITDDTSLSVEKRLHLMGIAVRIQRFIHWEIGKQENASAKQWEADVATAKKSFELYNHNKEYLLQTLPSSDLAFLTRCSATEDALGRKTAQVLQKHYGITTFASLRHSVLWLLTVDENATFDKEEVIEKALATNIFNNPISHWREHYEH